MKKSKKRLAILPRTQYLITLSVNMAPATLSSFFSFCVFVSRAWLNPCKNRWFRMVLCFKTFFDGKCDIARNAIFDNPFGKYGRVGPEAYFRDCLFFYELCSFVVREPCLGLSGGLGEPWAPKFLDPAQPLESPHFIKEYR